MYNHTPYIPTAFVSLLLKALSAQAESLGLTLDSLHTIDDIQYSKATNIVSFMLWRMYSLSCPDLTNEDSAICEDYDGNQVVTLLNHDDMMSTCIFKNSIHAPETPSSYRYWEQRIGFKGLLTRDQMAFVVKLCRLFGFVLVNDFENVHGSYALYSMAQVNTGYIHSESGRAALRRSEEIIASKHHFSMPDLKFKFRECRNNDLLLIQPDNQYQPGDDELLIINNILAQVGSKLSWVDIDAYVLSPLPDGSKTMDEMEPINLAALFASINADGELANAQNEWLREYLSRPINSKEASSKYQLADYPHMWVVLLMQLYSVTHNGEFLTFGRFVGSGYQYRPVWRKDPRA